jgi:hypothetical protein
MFNKFWNSKIRFNWTLGLILIIALGVPRFMIVLRANVTGNFYFVPIVFLLISSILWIIFMFLTSRVFYFCKKMTSSILGAIISHAAFNLTMMYLIFYYILK